VTLVLDNEVHDLSYVTNLIEGSSTFRQEWLREALGV